MSGELGTESVTIASGASLSDALDLGPYKLFALVVPAGFTGTSVTFAAAVARGGPYWPVYTDAGDEVTVTVAASTVVGVDVAAGPLAALRWVKLRAGTLAAPAAQSGAQRIDIMAQG